MGQCHGCVRYILFVFNFALWLLGCALLSVGIWLKMDDSANHYVQQMTDKVDDTFKISYSSTGGDDVTSTLAYLLIAFGIILIIITFIGCCGAVRENTCLLGTFAICLFALMAALIGIGIWAFEKRENVDAHTESLRNRTDANIDHAIYTYWTQDSSMDFMNMVHKRFRCCGGENNYRDFHGRIPRSCEPDNHERGCSYFYFTFTAREIEAFLRHRYTIITGVSLGVAFALGIGMALALLFCVIVRRATRLVVH